MGMRCIWQCFNVLFQIPTFNFVYLFRSMSQKKREDVLAQFKKPLAKIPVILISLKAGGVGLNLVNANVVFFLDAW